MFGMRYSSYAMFSTNFPDFSCCFDECACAEEFFLLRPPKKLNPDNPEDVALLVVTTGKVVVFGNNASFISLPDMPAPGFTCSTSLAVTCVPFDPAAVCFP